MCNKKSGNHCFFCESDADNYIAERQIYLCRKCSVVFSFGVDHAEKILDELNSERVTAHWIADDILKKKPYYSREEAVEALMDIASDLTDQMIERGHEVIDYMLPDDGDVPCRFTAEFDDGSSITTGAILDTTVNEVHDIQTVDCPDVGCAVREYITFPNGVRIGIDTEDHESLLPDSRVENDICDRISFPNGVLEYSEEKMGADSKLAKAGA